MTSSAQLRAVCVTALKGATLAGQNVFSPGDLPSWSGGYPLIKLQTPIEDKESLGRGTPQYTVTATIKITARVQNVDAGQAELDLETIKGQIEVALINNPAIWLDPVNGGSLIQQMPFMRSEIEVTAEGKEHIGELVVHLGIEFYQGPEDFFPVAAVPIARFTLDADLINVADPTGTYPDPPFPQAVEPAPRTQGPDGRSEGGFDITFPE